MKLSWTVLNEIERKIRKIQQKYNNNNNEIKIDKITNGFEMSAWYRVWIHTHTTTLFDSTN